MTLGHLQGQVKSIRGGASLPDDGLAPVIIGCFLNSWNKDVNSINTRTGRGHIMPPPTCFRKCLKKWNAQRRHICGTCAQITNTLCAYFYFICQHVRSPGQVKGRCAFRDRLQTSRSCCGLWAQFLFECFQTSRMRYWRRHLQNFISDFVSWWP